MKKVLLIYPTMVTEAPMTLAMLGAVLKQEGYEVHTCVNTFKHPLDVPDFINEAKKLKPEFVGISMITFEVNFVYRIINALKANGFTVILGGAHPTVNPLESNADIVVRGEGEETLREIVQDKPLRKILGITTREFSTPDRPRLNINTLPQPDLNVFNHELFREAGIIKGFHRIYTSRGCPGYCTFCDWKVFKQEFKEYDVFDIVEEIKRRRDDYGITSFSIADDCFTVNSDRVFKFCKLVRRLGIQWRANSRANLVTQDMLYAMKDSGCHSIAFGFESGDPDTLRRIAKGVTLDDNICAPKMANFAGLEVYGCLMCGFPWETPEHIENQIKFIHEVWNDVSLFQVSGSLMPFPGSAIYRKYSKEYNFEKFWLRPDYQKFGIQVYQNALNPYKVSTFYQRYLFDDTYIREEYFFKYSDEYKKAVRKMVLEIGRHNLRFMFPEQPLKQKLYLGLARLSMFGSDLFPNLEKNIGGTLFNGRTKIEKIRDNRRGITKRYTNPN